MDRSTTSFMPFQDSLPFTQRNCVFATFSSPEEAQSVSMYSECTVHLLVCVCELDSLLCLFYIYDHFGHSDHCKNRRTTMGMYTVESLKYALYFSSSVSWGSRIASFPLSLHLSVPSLNCLLFGMLQNSSCCFSNMH